MQKNVSLVSQNDNQWLHSQIIRHTANKLFKWLVERHLSTCNLVGHKIILFLEFLLPSFTIRFYGVIINFYVTCRSCFPSKNSFFLKSLIKNYGITWNRLETENEILLVQKIMILHNFPFLCVRRNLTINTFLHDFYLWSTRENFTIMGWGHFFNDIEVELRVIWVRFDIWRLEKGSSTQDFVCSSLLNSQNGPKEVHKRKISFNWKIAEGD